VHLHALRRRRRRVSPELVDDALDRHGIAGTGQQQREQRALLGAAQRHAVTVGTHLERPQDTELDRRRFDCHGRRRDPTGSP
jgi:hypothetical protein